MKLRGLKPEVSGAEYQAAPIFIRALKGAVLAPPKYKEMEELAYKIKKEK
ncbi:MAG: hypothetical protein PHC33_02560 [Candidatus Omnitrophica bacterium]|nr:hypothetical protein [Candidatus Omnitrophota bacterium]